MTITLLGTLFLRRRSASVRHSVLAAAMLGVLVVPPLVPMLPHWSLAIVEMTNHVDSHHSNEIAHTGEITYHSPDTRHSREGGNPDERLASLDSRLRGNDEKRSVIFRRKP